MSDENFKEIMGLIDKMSKLLADQMERAMERVGDNKDAQVGVSTLTKILTIMRDDLVGAAFLASPPDDVPDKKMAEVFAAIGKSSAKGVTKLKRDIANFKSAMEGNYVN